VHHPQGEIDTMERRQRLSAGLVAGKRVHACVACMQSQAWSGWPCRRSACRQPKSREGTNSLGCCHARQCASRRGWIDVNVDTSRSTAALFRRCAVGARRCCATDGTCAKDGTPTPTPFAVTTFGDACIDRVHRCACRDTQQYLGSDVLQQSVNHAPTRRRRHERSRFAGHAAGSRRGLDVGDPPSMELDVECGTVRTSLCGSSLNALRSRQVTDPGIGCPRVMHGASPTLSR
jgi:hypothetical protein